MKIHLPAYSQSSHRIEEMIAAQDLDLDPEVFVSEIRADLTFDRHDPYLDFKIALTSRIRLECDRCLDPYDYELVAEGPMFFILGTPTRGEDIDDTEVSYIPVATRDVDLGPLLRDLLILSVPAHRLCREDCLGICPECGANRNRESCSCNGLSSAEPG